MRQLSAANRTLVARYLPVALLSLSAIYVFRGALNVYFAQDDFKDLAVAVGVYPRQTDLWRYVSVQVFMDVFYPLFRDHPWPYHAVSLALHCLNAGLLYTLISRRLTRSAALIGTSFFAVHPALFTALFWESARADLMATTFALATLVLSLREGRARWFAIPVFALSLLSKESSLLIPVVIVVVGWWLRKRAGRPSPDVDRMLLVLFLMSALYLVYLARPGVAGIQVGFEPGAAYALDFEGSPFRNLLTYAAWTADIAMLRPGLRFVDQQDPAAFPFAIGVLIVTVLLSLWPALRRRGWPIGIVSFVLLLAPVLPLKNHAYHYYLYLPLTAAAWCLAALADTLLAGVKPPRGRVRPKGAADRGDDVLEGAGLASWIAAGACWLLLTWNGARLVAQMENRPSPVFPGLRGDPIVDRALIAQRAIGSLRGATIPNGTELVLIMRERIALEARIVRGSGEEPPPSQEVYPETNVKAALFGGVGVRALVPSVDSVRFVLSLGQPNPRARYGVYAPTGEVEVYEAASIDSLLRSSWVTRW